MGLHRYAGGNQGSLRVTGSLNRNGLIGFAVNQQHRRMVGAFGLQRFWCHQRAGEGQDGAWRRRTAKTGEQGDHRSLAEAHDRVRVGGKFKPVEFGIDKAVQVWGGGPDARFHHRRRAVGDAPPLAAEAGVVLEWRMHRREQGIRAGVLPGWCQVDQVVGIGPQAMAQNDQLPGLGLGRGSPVNGVKSWHDGVSHSCAPHSCGPIVWQCGTLSRMMVTRFAPSPTGFLHLGHAYSAFNAWKRAREAGGRFLLRLEDIDPTRCRPEFAVAIQEDLAWLGLDWDGPVRVQSSHLPEYQTVLDGLAEHGLVYPCFCTRADIAREVAASANAPHGPDGALLYPGTCRRLSKAERADRIASGERYAVRLDMANALVPDLTYHEEREGRIMCHPERFGDVVLARKDAPASYHLCVTHDDAVQGVTLVTRGEDLRPATDLHRLLQALMGWPTPDYAHHRILVDAAGRRLAKRDSSATLRSRRAEGASARTILDLFDQ